MKRTLRITRYYPGAVFFLLLCVSFTHCKKNSSTPVEIIPVNAQLKADYSFKPGTYWIYKDSLSGEVDSAYVISDTSVLYRAGGCVPTKNEVEVENLFVKVGFSCITAPEIGHINSVSESWNLRANMNTLYLSTSNTADSIESLQSMELLQYPLAVGIYMMSYGCLLPPLPDSGTVNQILPALAVNGNSFSAVAVSNHSSYRQIGSAPHAYNDCYYLSGGSGIVKVVINHNADSTYRVLQLQRYSIVK